MQAVTIQRVAAGRLWPLRHAVLRAGLPAEAAVFDFDHDPRTVHLAATEGGRVVGSATLHPDAFDGLPAWRLRGMAVDPALRRAGVGRLLLAAVDAHVVEAGPPLLWCNARSPAVPFYAACGWTRLGDAFDIPTAGPHYRMVKRFTAADPSLVPPAPGRTMARSLEKAAMPTRVTIWHEYRHEKKYEDVRKLYPEGIHTALAKHLRQQDGLTVRLAALDDPEHGLTQENVDATDVMLWWGHGHHGEVEDAIVDRVHKRCLAGMGLIVLHSGHYSKIFRRLMGTTCDLKWREADDREILWVVRPGHPILAGIDDHFVLPQEEMYGEFFDVPEPDELLLVSTFSGGECFRSGMTWQRGAGKIFYFRPGHEKFPTYYDPNVLKVLTNAVSWARPLAGAGVVPSGCVKSNKGWIEGRDTAVSVDPGL